MLAWKKSEKKILTVNDLKPDLKVPFEHPLEISCSVMNPNNLSKRWGGGGVGLRAKVRL